MEALTMPVKEIINKKFIQSFDENKYAKLLIQVSPRPITTDSEHRAFLETTSSLMKKELLTAEETALLSLLTVLISSYERGRYANLFEKCTPAEILVHLMEENHLTQNDFPQIPQSRISDIVSGKRKISLLQARIFAQRFKVNPALFLYGSA